VRSATWTTSPAWSPSCASCIEVKRTETLRSFRSSRLQAPNAALQFKHFHRTIGPIIFPADDKVAAVVRVPVIAEVAAQEFKLYRDILPLVSALVYKAFRLAVGILYVNRLYALPSTAPGVTSNGGNGRHAVGAAQCGRPFPAEACPPKPWRRGGGWATSECATAPRRRSPRASAAAAYHLLRRLACAADPAALSSESPRWPP
jgi:hypothetical protein